MSSSGPCNQTTWTPVPLLLTSDEDTRVVPVPAQHQHFDWAWKKMLTDGSMVIFLFQKKGRLRRNDHIGCCDWQHANAITSKTYHQKYYSYILLYKNVCAVRLPNQVRGEQLNYMIVYHFESDPVSLVCMFLYKLRQGNTKSTVKTCISCSGWNKALHLLLYYVINRYQDLNTDQDDDKPFQKIRLPVLKDLLKKPDVVLQISKQTHIKT